MSDDKFQIIYARAEVRMTIDKLNDAISSLESAKQLLQGNEKRLTTALDVTENPPEWPDFKERIENASVEIGAFLNSRHAEMIDSIIEEEGLQDDPL